MNPLLRRLYEAIPPMQCKPGCTDCCGRVPFSRPEWAAVPVKRRQKDGCLDCPFIKAGVCSIYEHRPFICRLFAATEDPDLQCPHGCKPEHPLSQAQTDALVNAYMGAFPPEVIA